MPNWEYKVITSGSLGFASLPLLEQHLNQLGKEEWEIIHFQTRPDNPLAFHGLARRPVMRDWVVEAAAPAGGPAMGSGAVPAPPAEKSAAAPTAKELRAEAEERRESLLAREESLRPLHGETGDAEGEGREEFDEFEDDEDLPTFFEAIRPHLRRNQRGPGLAAGIDYLAKKFEQTEGDLIEALKECGFTIPAGAKDEPAYLEYDGDLYWLNINHRGQLWINTREKPRPVFKPVQGTKARAGEEAPAGERVPEKAKGQQRLEHQSPESSHPVAEATLPESPALLDRLRPMMRRNRRGEGLSGSVSYLARGLNSKPPVLVAAFGALGLVPPAGANERPVFVEIGAFVYWLNQDKSGQIWINAREKRGGEERPEAEAAAGSPVVPQTELPLEAVAPAADSKGRPPGPAKASPFAAVRLLLKETRRGSVAAEVGRIAEQLDKSTEELLAALTDGGLKVPEKAREKPVFAGHAGEIFWLNRNAKGELWLNAKASKYPAKEDDADTARKPARRSRTKKAE
ncbi:MAG: hypothetical protein PHE83_11045 [Opitutaceae bacterium]|nr:hypothetical protein [Opitutaceae bacterium]